MRKETNNDDRHDTARCRREDMDVRGLLLELCRLIEENTAAAHVVAMVVTDKPLTVAEAAAYCGLPQPMIREAIAAGTLPMLTVPGKKYKSSRLRRSDIDKWVRSALPRALTAAEVDRMVAETYYTGQIRPELRQVLASPSDPRTHTIR